MTFQEEENFHVEEILNGFGIHTRNEDGQYLSVNEVMLSVCKTLKQIRETNDEDYYRISKEAILIAILGRRYRYEVC